MIVEGKLGGNHEGFIVTSGFHGVVQIQRTASFAAAVTLHQPFFRG